MELALRKLKKYVRRERSLEDILRREMKMNAKEMKELTPEQEDLINDCHEKRFIEEEEKIEDKKLKECFDWWGSLTEEEQLKIMIDYYPTEVKEDTDIDKMFGDMPSDEQLWIYIRVTTKEKEHKTIPINPDKFDEILIRIGRRKQNSKKEIKEAKTNV